MMKKKNHELQPTVYRVMIEIVCITYRYTYLNNVVTYLFIFLFLFIYLNVIKYGTLFV